MPAVIVSTTIPPEQVAKLERVAAAVRASGNKELRRELEKGLRRAVRPMQKTFRAGALGYLPFRGGLAEWVASDMRFRTSVSVGERTRLRIRASLPGHDLPAINRGRLRHPVFGNRENWVLQLVRPHFWDDAGILGAQEAEKEIVAAVDRTAGKLEAEL